MSIERRAREIICEQFDVPMEEVVDEARFIDDFGADSLGFVECILAFEERFEIGIPDEDAIQLQTVGAAIAYVTKAAENGGVVPTHSLETWMQEDFVTEEIVVREIRSGTILFRGALEKLKAIAGAYAAGVAELQKSGNAEVAVKG